VNFVFDSENKADEPIVEKHNHPKELNHLAPD
jgi:hypothetical protein